MKRKPRKKPLIYMDKRENNSGIEEYLKKHDLEIKKKQLEVGDYLASERVVIERKTHKDLVDSIIDKRLFEQAKDLKEHFTNPIIIIEGRRNLQRNIHPNALRGALASIVLNYEIPTLYTKDKEETAAMIYRIAYREQVKEKKKVRVKGKKTPLLLDEQQLHLVQSLPGIGPELAKSILGKLKTIKRLANASKTQLREIDGIGNKKARKIREVINKEWKRKNKI
ncbi:MAG: ERCC4 domain-containing protein [archaeon]